jgi:hypothetical protein
MGICLDTGEVCSVQKIKRSDRPLQDLFNLSQVGSITTISVMATFKDVLLCEK